MHTHLCRRRHLVGFRKPYHVRFTSSTSAKLASISRAFIDPASSHATFAPPCFCFFARTYRWCDKLSAQTPPQDLAHSSFSRDGIRIFLFISSCSETVSMAFAHCAPLVATAGTPIPEVVESPQR